MKALSMILVALGLALSGCGVYEIEVESGDGSSGTTVYDEEPFVDAYVYIPYKVKLLIENRVSGYSMPRQSQYSIDLYPYGINRSPDDLPCYVRADFNGDDVDDYAMLFSKEVWRGGQWYITTKLIVVASTYYGHELSVDLILGTVTAPASSPVEEYWAIGLMRKGTHTVSTYYQGTEIHESVTLDEDAFFLTSLDPLDRSLFYVVDSETFEMAWDNGTLAKRKANALSKSRAARVIELKRP